jgi:hypothetical protein
MAFFVFQGVTMSDLFSEPRISLTELAKREVVHVSTVWRWCLRGCKGHRLESFAVGGRRYTTLPAYDRWLAKINCNDAPPSPPSPHRESAHEKAKRDLDEILKHKERRDAENGDSPPPAPQ